MGRAINLHDLTFLVPLKNDSIQRQMEQTPAPEKMANTLYAEIRWFCRVLLSAGDRFYFDNGLSRAAGLAYTSLLSLVPLTALAFSWIAAFAVSNQYAPEVRKFIFHQFVPTPETVDTILEYLGQFSTAMADQSLFVILFVVVTSLLLINSVEAVLNEVWQVYETRSIADRIAIYCSIIVIAPVLAVSAFYFIKLRLEPFLADIGINGQIYSDAYKFLMPLLIDFLAFTALFYLVPKAPVKLRSACFGALIAALLFGLAKGGFAFYVESFTGYNKVYGALAAIPIFLFWLYLTWIVVLFGAECSFQAQYLPKTGTFWKRTATSTGDGQMLTAVQALVMIGRAFRDGGKSPSELDVAEAIGCSSVILKPAINALEKAEIIARGDSRERPLTLLKSPETVTLAEIHMALFRGRSELRFPAELEATFCAFGPGKDAAQVTLAQVVAKG